MSYTIEYKKRVYGSPAEDNLDENSLLCLNLVGPSNCYIGRARERYWWYVGYGWRYSVIMEICKIAGETEGRLFQPHNRGITPEKYIKQWRRKFKNAPHIEQFFDDFHYIKGIIRIRKEKDKGKWTRGWYYKKLQENNKAEFSKICSDGRHEYLYDISNIDDLKAWNNYSSYGYTRLSLKNGQEIE